MADKVKKPKDPRGAAVVKSERALNSILSAYERLGRRGRGLTDEQKTKVMSHITKGVDHLGKVLAGQEKAKEGVTL